MKTFVIDHVGSEFRAEGNPKHDPATGVAKGLSPTEILANAVAACAGGVYQDVLDNSHVAAHVETITVQYEQFKSPKVNAIESIDLYYKVTAETEKDADRAERYVKFVHRYCPVIQSLRTDITVTDHVTVDITAA